MSSDVHIEERFFGAWQYWRVIIEKGVIWEEWYLFGFRVKRRLLSK